MRFSISHDVLRFTMGQHSVEGRIVHTDELGFSVETLSGEVLSIAWELVGAGLRVERIETPLRRAA